MLTQRERDYLDQAVALARSSASDPSSAAASAPALGRALEFVQIGARRRMTCQRVIRTTFTQGVSVAGGVVTPTLLTPVTWNRSYHVVGCKVSVLEGTSKLPNVTLSIQFADSSYAFVTQNAAQAFVDFETLQGSAVDSSLGYFPLDEYVTANSQWNVQCSSDDASGNATYTPRVYFLVEPWDSQADPLKG